MGLRSNLVKPGKGETGKKKRKEVSGGSFEIEVGQTCQEAEEGIPCPENLRAITTEVSGKKKKCSATSLALRPAPGSERCRKKEKTKTGYKTTYEVTGRGHQRLGKRKLANFTELWKTRQTWTEKDKRGLTSTKRAGRIAAKKTRINCSDKAQLEPGCGKNQNIS